MLTVLIRVKGEYMENCGVNNFHHRSFYREKTIGKFEF